MKTVIWGLLIPFIGTAAGAACVFFLKKDLQAGVQRALPGFAAGVMVAASIRPTRPKARKRNWTGRS